MLLLHNLMEEFSNNDEVFTELNFVEVINILSIKHFLFFPFEDIKSNLSENVLCVQFLFKQNIFLVFNKSIVCLTLEYPGFLFGVQSQTLPDTWP